MTTVSSLQLLLSITCTYCLSVASCRLFFKLLTARNKTQVQLILSAFTYTLHIHLILHTVHYELCLYKNIIYSQSASIPALI